MDLYRRAFRCNNMEERCRVILIRAREIMSFKFRRARCPRERLITTSGLSGQILAIKRRIICGYFASGASFNDHACVLFDRRLALFCNGLTGYGVTGTGSTSEEEMIIKTQGRLSKNESVQASNQRMRTLITRYFVVLRFRYLRTQEILPSSASRFDSQVGRGRIKTRFEGLLLSTSFETLSSNRRNGSEDRASSSSRRNRRHARLIINRDSRDCFGGIYSIRGSFLG